MLSSLQADTSAKSTAASRASCVRTWALMHRLWFGDSSPTLPLTCDSIRAVAAQMKSAGYRSFVNYLDTMRALHVEEYDWTPAMVLCRKRCLASTQRGIGPARQSMELPLQGIRDLDLGAEPLVPDGPCCPMHWAILCCFHVLRGAESACALASSLQLDRIACTERFMLPVSKTDPQAIGCSRTWGCVCTSASRGALTACPFHSAAALLDHHQNRFSTTGASLPADLPLFPGRDGGWCSRDGFLGTIAELARRLSACTTDSLGRNIVGEHTWRVTGSRHLASLDVPLPIIRLLARWGGETIMRYVQDAPLSSLTRLYLDRVAAADGAVRGIAAAAQATASSAPPAISPVLTPAESASAFTVDPLLDADVPEPLASPPFFRRAGPRTKVHMVSLPPRLGVKGDQLPCGRQYTESGVFSSAVPINLPLCDKCGSLRLWATAMAIASSIIPADSA
jgi:hypothetical protein